MTAKEGFLGFILTDFFVINFVFTGIPHFVRIEIKASNIYVDIK